MSISKVWDKRTIKFDEMNRIRFFICLALMLCLQLPAKAYSFSAVNAGHTIYYNITSSTAPYTVEVTNNNGSGNPSYYTTPINNNSYSGAITIPSLVTYNGNTYSVTSIGGSAFWGCINLTSITIPTSITSIGQWSFWGCSGLSNIIIPSSITSLGTCAFFGSGLTGITIPSSVTSIGDWTFRNCNKLMSITVSSNNQNYASLDDILYKKNANKLVSILCCPIKKTGNIIIPNSVTAISGDSFSGCRCITSVTIPASVTSIGGYVFKDCISLAAVIINTATPPTLTSFSSYPIFYGVSSSMPIYVPCGSVSAYANHTYWGHQLYGGVTTSNIIGFSGDTIINDIFLSASSTYIQNGFNITNAHTGIYVRSVDIAGSACDSLVILNLVVNPTTNINITTTICQGESYSFAGNNLTTAGTYTNMFSTSDSCNCDSSVTLTLNVIPAFNTSISQTICQGTSYNFGGIARTTAGTYIDTLQTASGCDSIITLTLNINPNAIFNTPVTQTICQGESFAFAGNNLTTAGTYNDTLQTVNGCDSVITLTLNVNPTFNTPIAQTICEGESYLFGGIARTSAGTYTDTLQTVNGCDSVITLTLNVNPIFNTPIAQTICEGESFAFGGNNLTTAGTYNDTLQTVNGCDSVITLTLAIAPLRDTMINDTICEGEIYTLHGFELSQQGTYTQQLQNDYGCNSILTLNLTVLPVYDTIINVIIDSGRVYNNYGITATEDGTYEGLFPNPNGCEGKITVNLLVCITVPMFVPNAFTPLKDNNNTFSYCTIKEATVETFEIYNRWGQKVFEMTADKKYWDGKCKGVLCPMGSYVYKISYTTIYTGTRHFFKQGIINLVR